MSTGNKRTTQLVALPANEVAADDLFYIVDSSAKESKKITAGDVAVYLSLSGSLYVVRAALADTASYILGSNVVGPVLSGSFAQAAMTAVSASYALSAKSSSWGQRSETASYAMAGLVTTALSSSHADFADSASYAEKAALADNANVAAYLYYSGGDNGTASYAVKTGIVTDAINAQTASYMINGIGPTVDSASWANVAGLAMTTSYAAAANYLVYSPNNGTASYAISAGSTGGKMNVFGVWNAITSSNSSAIINTLDVRSSLSSSQETMIEVYGNAILNFTASMPTFPSLSLYIFDRSRGDAYLSDVSIVALATTPIQNKWDSLETGSFFTSFQLLAQQPMYGKYYLIVTSSSPTLLIDTASRNVKYKFTSYSDNLNAYPDDDPWDFWCSPPAALLTYYTGTLPSLDGPYTTGLGPMLTTGSNNISILDMSSQNIDDVRYTYYLYTCSFFNCNNNPSLTTLDYKFPDTLISLWCSDCGLTSIFDLTNTQLYDLSCSYNSLTYLPALPATLKYLDCSYNITLNSFPNLPSGLETLIADYTSVTGSLLYSLPGSLITASFSASYLNALPASLPSTLGYLNIAQTAVVFMPTLPTPIIYLNASYAALTTTEIEDLTTDLVSNGQSNGYLDLRGYGTFTSVIILTNLSLLTVAGWTILTDP